MAFPGRGDREEVFGRRGNQYYVGRCIGDVCKPPSGDATGYWEWRAGSREESGLVLGV